MGGTEAEAKNNLGFAYERRGDMANAYDLYVEAVRLDPKAERARSNLVHAAVVLGRPVPPEAVRPGPGRDRAAVVDSAASAKDDTDAPKRDSATAPLRRLSLLTHRKRRRTREEDETVLVVRVRRGGDVAERLRHARTSATSTRSAYAAWFNAQHAKAKPASPEEARRIIESLDAQEAAAVSKSYRQGRLARRGRRRAC